MGMKGAARANYLSNPTITGAAGFADGTVTAPSIAWTSDQDGTGTGFFRTEADAIAISIGGTATGQWGGSAVGLRFRSSRVLSWSSAADTTSASDLALSRAAANSIQFSGTTAATSGAVTSRTEINKATSAIANAAATTVLTVTIPNAAHSFSIELRVTGSLGAGGAVGANEASATNMYVITGTRTAGVACVVAISSAFGAAAAAVAGAATVTCTAAVTAMTGLVSATQTFDIQVTISRSGGSSTNHTCVTHAALLNANVTGVTIA